MTGRNLDLIPHRFIISHFQPNTLYTFVKKNIKSFCLESLASICFSIILFSLSHMSCSFLSKPNSFTNIDQMCQILNDIYIYHRKGPCHSLQTFWLRSHYLFPFGWYEYDPKHKSKKIIAHKRCFISS